MLVLFTFTRCSVIPCSHDCCWYRYLLIDYSSVCYIPCSVDGVMPRYRYGPGVDVILFPITAHNPWFYMPIHFWFTPCLLLIVVLFIHYGVDDVLTPHLRCYSSHVVVGVDGGGPRYTIWSTVVFTVVYVTLFVDYGDTFTILTDDTMVICYITLLLMILFLITMMCWSRCGPILIVVVDLLLTYLPVLFDTTTIYLLITFVDVVDDILPFDVTMTLLIPTLFQCPFDWYSVTLLVLRPRWCRCWWLTPWSANLVLMLMLWCWWFYTHCTVIYLLTLRYGVIFVGNLIPQAVRYTEIWRWRSGYLHEILSGIYSW